MHLIDTPGSLNGRFVPGNPFLGTNGTIFDHHMANALMLELATVIESAGIQLDKTRHDQLRSAIQAMTLSGGGSLAALQDASRQDPSLWFRPELQGPVVLLSAGQQKNDDEPAITAGATPNPPSASATVNANGYEGGTDNEQDGHFWPYQAPFGAQMQATGGLGWYPMCVDGEGINHYVWPDFLTAPGMFGIGGGLLRIQIDGQVDVDGVNPDGYGIEVVVMRNPTAAWNNGDGGMVNNAGTFASNRVLSTVSPLLTNSISTVHNVRVVIELWAIFKRVLQGTAHWLISPSTGDQAPVVDEVRSVSYTGGGAVAFQPTAHQWKVLTKIDAFDGPDFPSRVVCNTPFGGGGTTPPQAEQDGSECKVSWYHGRVDYFPAAG